MNRPNVARASALAIQALSSSTNRKRGRLRHFLPLLLLAPLRAQPADPLITEVVSLEFLQAIGVRGFNEITFGTLGIVYRCAPPAAGQAQRVEVGVYPSVAEAQAVCQSARGKLAAPRTLAGIGHEAVWAQRAGAPATLLLRRDNVVLRVEWTGAVEAGTAFARQLDGILSDVAICQRSDRVNLPTLELTAPRQVNVGEPFAVRWKVTKGPWVRCARTPGQRSQGEVTVRIEKGDGALLRVFTDSREALVEAKRGSVPVFVPLATAGNVMFGQRVEVEVVGAPAASAAQAWVLREGKVYFVERPDQDWAAAPEGQREWLDLARRGLRPLAAAEVATWRQRAVNDLTGVLASAWLPPSALVAVHENAASVQRQVVYDASYALPRAHVAVWGEVGRRFWVYAEQPEPLPAGMAELTPGELFRTDLLTPEDLPGGERNWPRAEVVVRRYQRLRGLEPKGPFTPVRVLLAAVRLPEETNLRFPGGW